MLNRFRCGNHAGIGKGLNHGRKAEIKIRVAVADVDGVQRFADGFDFLHQRFGIVALKLAVYQHHFFIAFHNHGGYGKNAVVAGVEYFVFQIIGHGQRCGQTEYGDKSACFHVGSF